MANLRRTKIPNDLEAFASALSGFPQSAIDQACTRIEEADVIKGEPAFPRLGRLLEECRLTTARIHYNHDIAPKKWSVERYRLCKDFDGWLRYEQEQHDAGRHSHKTSTEALEAFPRMAIRWAAWKNAIADGSMDCPGWCDTCDGMGYIVKPSPYNPQDSYADRCPDCVR